MTYTAENVREMREWLDAQSHVASAFSHRRIAAMLTAYADRLEQDEQHLRPEPMPKGLVYGGMKYEVWRPDQEVRVTVEESETYRRGKLEVYTELAKVNPFNADAADYHLCNFCSGPAYGAVDAVPRHKPDCLWLRATAALRETTPTP